MEKGERSQLPHGGVSSSQSSSFSGKLLLKDIAASTLKNIERGSYEVDGISYDLKEKIDLLKANTTYYAGDSDLSEWSSIPQALVDSESKIHVTVSECSTLAGARGLTKSLPTKSSDVGNASVVKRVGVLSFGSAKNPGGGFIKGAQAQEESIARSSTLYPSLVTKPAERFYRSHRKEPKQGYYSHAMIYSPRVLFIRDDKGEWQSPVEVDVLTSAGVNAGVVRRYLRERNSEDESGIYIAMKERMARILFLFERRGVRNVVLGSFGTGAFRNNVELVAGIWAELLTSADARFRYSFDHVVFAILGYSTFKTFEKIFANSISHS